MPKHPTRGEIATALRFMKNMNLELPLCKKNVITHTLEQAMDLMPCQKAFIDSRNQHPTFKQEHQCSCRIADVHFNFPKGAEEEYLNAAIPEACHANCKYKN
jgi:hypothetical protein